MTKFTPQQIDNHLIGVRSAPPRKIVKPNTGHDEATLHLQFCKWVKNGLPIEQPGLPPLQFVRHEREKARSYYMQNFMRVYNSDIDKLPDFELLVNSYKDGRPTLYYGFYLEFKKPGRNWTLSDGITLAKGFEGQYACHCHLWNIGRCAYFCNDLEQAKGLLRAYLAGSPVEQQKYIVRDIGDVDGLF